MSRLSKPVPEISVSALPDIVNAISLRRRCRLRSFGAYVIREGGEEVALECINLLGELEGTDAYFHTVTFTEKAVGNVHKDEGKRNDATVHWTTVGSVDALVLPGHTEPAVVSLMFDEAVVRLAIAANLHPIRNVVGQSPLRTVLDEGDVMIFDHSKPHAFKSLTDTRESTAMYLYV